MLPYGESVTTIPLPMTPYRESVTCIPLPMPPYRDRVTCIPFARDLSATGTQQRQCQQLGITEFVAFIVFHMLPSLYFYFLCCIYCFPQGVLLYFHSLCYVYCLPH